MKKAKVNDSSAYIIQTITFLFFQSYKLIQSNYTTENKVL